MRWLPRAAAMVLFMLGGSAVPGPRLSLPADPVPYQEALGDPRWRAAAPTARQSLEGARARHGLPALSVAVIVNGKPAWAAAISWADVAARAPATLATRYRLGSTSRAVTATVLARLVDQGVMTLDAPIANWRNDLPNKAWLQLIPRQLASHTAGIADYDQNRDLIGLIHSIRERTQFDSVGAALSVFDGNRLKYKPGTGFRYTSYDVVLLSAVMERAANAPFLDLLAREITQPLGVASLGADDQRVPVPDRATFCQHGVQGVKRWRAVNHRYKWAAGGLIASSSDLARIGAAWFDPAYIRPKTRAAFWEPQRLADGTLNPQSYALGWRANDNRTLLGPARPVWNVHHGGVSKGAYSWLCLYPELGIVVSLNANARLDDFVTFIAIEQEITRTFVEAAKRG
jgi:serine beta-lactamase-like protein LACTB, mitochondrial